MKYDLSKLTKNDIEKLIKNLPPKFSGLYGYAPSHQNKIIKVITEKEDNIVELYDNKEVIHDQWGEYNISNNSLFVMAWDPNCFWKVGVYLYEDHYEIPKYKNSFESYETENDYLEYRKNLFKIFKAKANLKNLPRNKQSDEMGN